MPARIDDFGALADGTPVRRATLSHHDGLSVELLDYGATLRALTAPLADGRRIATILGYGAAIDYEKGIAYLGATIGRCAGRTALSPGAPYPLTRNAGPHHLHGGRRGLSHRSWRIVDHGDRPAPHVRLSCRVVDGEDGYPGNLDLVMTVTLPAPLTLDVAIAATGDRDTPLSLTLHPYFNLSGDPAATIVDHELTIAADRFLELRDDLIPTGRALPVDGTPFDFRRARAIGARLDESHRQLAVAGGYDHYWPVDRDARFAAELFSPVTDLRMRLGTDQPGLQFYSGNDLGRTERGWFAARAGLCLEPHGFPNAINAHGFPDPTLRAGATYHHRTRYEFSHG